MIQSNVKPTNGQTLHPLTVHYQALVRKLETFKNEKRLKALTIGITSSIHGEGVTTVATNLAICAANLLQRPVLLIGTNRSGCSAERVLNMKNKSGLAELIAGSPEIMDSIESTNYMDLSFLSVGSETLLAEVIHDNSAMKDLIRELKKEFELIVFDLPVANELTPCFAIASQLDSTLLVVESEKTKDQVISRAKTQLLEAKANLQGVILNKRPQHIPNWLYHRI